MSQMLCLLVISATALTAAAAAEQPEFASHSPSWPLPVPSDRPLSAGPARFVDAGKGNDGNDGTEQHPWKTIGHALPQLEPGDTLYLRTGTYYESVAVTLAGANERPITLRAYPGELAVIDAGHREFFENPAAAWEPAPGSAVGEYRSTKSYKTGGGFGNFGDSMVPFHRYMNFEDLRSTNELYRESLNNRAADPVGLFSGPGTFRNPETGRIHIRLSHTQLAGLGENGYRGETDPRKLPLVIAGADFALHLKGARYVRVQDVVFRGAQRSAALIEDSQEIEFDGVTLYGSGSALRTSGVSGLKVTHSALRGHGAPWHSRFHHKNRAGSGYLVIAQGERFEFARCEMTDHHDALLLRDANHVELHHCRLDNFNDDGFEPGPKKAAQHMRIYQNVVTRILNPFTAHGQRTDPLQTEPGSGVYVYRNLFDLRQGTYGGPPAEPDPAGAYLDRPTSWLAHDHGSPTQPNYYVYHNTFLMNGREMRGYYACTWGAHTYDTLRRVFNNVFVQLDGAPGASFSGVSPDCDFQADSNLLWSTAEGADVSAALFAPFRRSPQFEASKAGYPPGWGARDLVADPKFLSLSDDRSKLDVRLQPDSPAIDAGVPLPAEWPDPLRDRDEGRPDIGAFPVGVPVEDVVLWRPREK